MVKAKKKYPDVESVLEVIRTRDEMGLPLSPGQLNKGQYPDPDLHKAGIRHCGTWQKAVEAAGFDYTNMLGKAKSRYPTADSVIREIQDRHKNGLPLNATDVGQCPGPHRDSTLHSAAKKHFGNWTAAVEAAGFDYAEIRPRSKRKYPDGDSVVTEIKRRDKNGFPLNGTSVGQRPGPHRDIGLYTAAKKVFGNWQAAIEAAGIEYKEVRARCRRYWDGEAVVAEIRHRAEAGLPINLIAVGKGEYCDGPLWTSGKAYFGSWRAAVEAAGFDYEDVRIRRKRRYPDADAVLAGIRARYAAGLPIGGVSVAREEAKDLPLYQSAFKFFKSWVKAVEAAGIDYAETSRVSLRYPDGNAVVREIKRRLEEGLLVNSKAVLQGEGREAGLVASGKRCFGSWDAALEAAGFNAGQIRFEARSKRSKVYADADAVRAGIQQRFESGKSLERLSLEKGEEADYPLYEAARMHVGSWRAAVESAGFESKAKNTKRCDGYAQSIKSALLKYPDLDSVRKQIRCRKKAGMGLRSDALLRSAHQDRALYLAGKELSGSWPNAVEQAGIAYPKGNFRRKYPEGKSVLAEIRRRHAAGIPVKGGAVLRGEHRDTMLYKTGREYFGNWLNAIEAAGLDYGEVSKQGLRKIVRRRIRKYADRDAVVSEIRKRAEAGQPLNWGALAKGQYKDTRLHRSGREYFGSWAAALEAADFDARKIHREATPSQQKYPDQKAVVAELRRRNKNQMPLNGVAVRIGKQRDNALHTTGIALFGSWRNAVEAAGFNYADCKPPPRRKYADADAVALELQRRHDAGLPLHSCLIRGHRDQALHHACKKFFGSWLAAVKASGLGGEGIQPPLRRYYPDAASVVAEICNRKQAELPLNASGLRSGKHRNACLYVRSQEYFGSWPAALVAAGIDPDGVIRQTRNAKKGG